MLEEEGHAVGVLFTSLHVAPTNVGNKFTTANTFSKHETQNRNFHLFQAVSLDYKVCLETELN